MTAVPPPPPPPTSGTFTPPQASYTLPPGAPPPPPQKSSGCWKALAIGCGIIIVLGAAAVGCLVIFGFSVIKRSDVYREAFTRASGDRRGGAALGTPIEKGWWVMGTVSADTNGGTATTDFPIPRTNGHARSPAAATREPD